MCYSFSHNYCEFISLCYYHLLYSLDVDQLKKVYLCAKHFDPQDIIDTQTYLDIDGETKTRNIQARLKKGALPKYLPNCPTYFNDNSIKQQRLDRDKRETELQMQVYT